MNAGSMPFRTGRGAGRTVQVDVAGVSVALQRRAREVGNVIAELRQPPNAVGSVGTLRWETCWFSAHNCAALIGKGWMLYTYAYTRTCQSEAGRRLSQVGGCAYEQLCRNTLAAVLVWERAGLRRHALLAPGLIALDTQNASAAAHGPSAGEAAAWAGWPRARWQAGWPPPSQLTILHCPALVR